METVTFLPTDHGYSEEEINEYDLVYQDRLRKGLDVKSCISKKDIEENLRTNIGSYTATIPMKDMPKHVEAKPFVYSETSGSGIDFTWEPRSLPPPIDEIPMAIPIPENVTITVADPAPTPAPAPANAYVIPYTDYCSIM